MLLTPSDLNAVHFTQQFTTGTRFFDGVNGYVYCRFTNSTGLTRGTVVSVADPNAISAAGGTGRGIYGVLLYDIPSSASNTTPVWGWVQIKGNITVRLAAGSANDPVHFSATAGELTNTGGTGRGIFDLCVVTQAPTSGIGRIYCAAELVASRVT